MAWAALPSTSDISFPTNSWLQNATAVVVPRRLTEVSNWAAMKTACDSSGTVTLSNGFVMGTYVSEILFADKQLVIMGNGKILDAGENGRFFKGIGSGSLEIHDVTMRKGQASKVSNTSCY